MAITKTIVIKADTSDAVKSFDDLTESIDKNERELVSLQKIYEKAPASKNQALKKRIDKLSGSIDKQKQSVKNLTKEQSKSNAVGKSTLSNVRDNGGAIAVLDSFTGGLATRVRDAAEASKLFSVTTKASTTATTAQAGATTAAASATTGFSLSLKGLRGALIATGIGALVVALGAIVVFWDDIVGFITQANAKLENQLTLVQSIGGVLDAELTTINKTLELNKLQGKANEELEKQKVAILERLREQNEAEVKILENQLERLKATSIEVGFWETIKNNVAFTLFGTKALASEASNLAAQRLAEINELATAIETSKLKEIDLAIQLFNAENPDSENGGGEKRDPLEKAEGIDFDAEKSQAAFDAKEEENARKLQQELEFNQGIEKIKAVSAQVQSDTELKWADLTAEAKLAIAGAVLQGAAGLVDQNSIAGKGIAIAQTGINATQGIMQAFATLPTIAAIPAAAIVGALGIKSIIDITKKKIPSATGRGFVGGGAGGGSAPPPAPSFNLVEGTEGSQLNESINLQNQQPIEAVVVSGNVTSAQSVDRNIVDGSGL